jgi:phosphoenolpyruvate synthase/pyruvate phosphate dikinase
MIYNNLSMLHLKQGRPLKAIESARRAIEIYQKALPADHPDLAKWLVEEGIESLSLNPDTVVETWLYLAREAQIKTN